ncbi:molybdenum cofactor guanylyltransferase MobA [Melaminivora sp.]|uniref:molybdenum cofactor guanylyltransferase MobA n=1 Tax=Melaminivora sp. TaxID=1933032 RepID=UPI0028ACAA6C|nr:molybdenum cofactor guanylyltransferase MobA [Melaminivora sp.]
MIDSQDITALVLAGGRGSRMGGVDKGLQPFLGTPLALHAARRIAPQVAGVMFNANRHLHSYAAWDLPVWPDAQADFAGPLAGFAAGLAHCPTPWLLTLPCDTPLFPPDLATRLAAAAAQAGAPLAMAAAPDEAGEPRIHAVFCLLRTTLLPDLERFIAAGGRRVQEWTRQHGPAVATFNRPDDDARAFANANTLEELRALEMLARGQHGG